MSSSLMQNSLTFLSSISLQPFVVVVVVCSLTQAQAREVFALAKLAYINSLVG